MDIRAGCRARPERILANGWKRGDEVKRSSPGRHDTLTYSRIPRNGVTTIPAVVSVLITDEAVEAAPQGDVLFIQYNPGEEFSPADVGADGSPV